MGRRYNSKGMRRFGKEGLCWQLCFHRWGHKESGMEVRCSLIWFSHQLVTHCTPSAQGAEAVSLVYTYNESPFMLCKCGALFWGLLTKIFQT